MSVGKILFLLSANYLSYANEYWMKARQWFNIIIIIYLINLEVWSWWIHPNQRLLQFFFLSRCNATFSPMKQVYIVTKWLLPPKMLSFTHIVCVIGKQLADQWLWNQCILLEYGAILSIWRATSTKIPAHPKSNSFKLHIWPNLQKPSALFTWFYSRFFPLFLLILFQRKRAKAFHFFRHVLSSTERQKCYAFYKVEQMTHAQCAETCKENGR